MGVELRIHTFFILLLGICMAYTESAHLSVFRGIGLWLVLLGTVAVREVARMIVAAYHGLQLRNILLLPIGGLVAYANAESAENAGAPKVQWRMALTGPLANLSFALVVAMLVLGMSPTLNLLDRPWITPAHLIRSIVWLNVFLGVLNLLPAYPLDGGRVVRGGVSRTQGRAQGSRVATGLGQILAMTAIIAGLVLMNAWLLMAGFFILIGAQLEDQGVLFQSVVDTVNMQDIMLTEFSMLAPSDTLGRCAAQVDSQPAGRLSRGARRQPGRHYLPPEHSFRTAQRGQRLCAGGDVAQLPRGPTGGLAGDHDQPLCRPWTVAGAGDRRRTHCRHCDPAEPDALHEPAGGEPETSSPEPGIIVVP